MGWGIDFKADVYLGRMQFPGIQDVKNKIEENEKSIIDAKKRLQMFISASPKDIIDPEWKEQPIDWLINSTDGWFDVIEDCCYENSKLQLYVDYLENKETNGE